MNWTRRKSRKHPKKFPPAWREIRRRSFSACRGMDDREATKWRKSSIPLTLFWTLYWTADFPARSQRHSRSLYGWARKSKTSRPFSGTWKPMRNRRRRYRIRRKSWKTWNGSMSLSTSKSGKPPAPQPHWSGKSSNWNSALRTPRRRLKSSGKSWGRRRTGWTRRG